MDKTERGRLLRKRYRAVGGLPYTVRNGAVKKAVREEGGKWRSSVFGVALHEQDRRKKWIAQNEPERALELRVKREHGPHALTRIAEKLPAKLPRVMLTQ